MEKGIWAISHLMDNYGNLLYYIDLYDKFNLQCSIREYNKVMKAIPAPLQTMIQQFVLYSNTIPEMRSLCIEGTNLKKKQLTNKFIRKVLSKQYFPSQLKIKYILQEFSEEEAKKIRKRYLAYQSFLRPKK